MSNPMVGGILGFASRLRFPGLLALTASILVLDLLIPDFLPFVDEILLSLVTLALAALRKPREAPADEAPVIDIDPTPPRDD
jgi:hypothetical protein